MTLLNETQRKQLNSVLSAEEERFDRLAEIAGVDPTRDLRFADLRDVDFAGSLLVGWDFTGADLRGASFRDARISECIFTDARGVDLKGAVSSPSIPTVTILLCTFNGERFLAEQLASLERQTFKNWKLIASDDGSCDRTKSILLAFQKSFEPGKVEIIDGPRRGATANFLSQACAENLAGEYYAFCDQDDVWDADKLERAIDALEQTDVGLPALYGSRTRLIDEAGNEIGFSPLFHRKPEFRGALVQSIAGGNTMVFNQKARELVMSCGADVDVPSHDWWLYQVISACGGRVHYDAHPSVRYRQHAHNVIGANAGWTARMHRLQLLRQGRFRHWEDLNVAALTRLGPRMSAENQRIFDLFRRARHEPLLRRAMLFARSGVYRQTVLSNLGLAAAVVLNKIAVALKKI
jgi:glycosyltransferase involved in cell wall biosynthesis